MPAVQVGEDADAHTAAENTNGRAGEYGDGDDEETLDGRRTAAAAVTTAKTNSDGPSCRPRVTL